MDGADAQIPKLFAVKWALLTMIIIGIGIQAQLPSPYVILLAFSSIFIVGSILIGIKTTQSGASRRSKSKWRKTAN